MQNEHPLFQRKLQYFAITAFFIVFAVACIVFFLVNVRIKTVDIENCTYSERASVLTAANIKTGTHSYAIDKDKIADAIKKSNPYVIDVRISNACHLLTGSDMSIKEIGSKVGYADPHFFSRIFKKRLGCSPMEYRNKYELNGYRGEYSEE